MQLYEVLSSIKNKEDLAKLFGATPSMCKITAIGQHIQSGDRTNRRIIRNA